MHDLIEPIAKALEPKCIPFSKWMSFDIAKELARAALTAIEAAGYVVVPREPTEAMLNAGYATNDYHEAPPEKMWQAMIAAANPKATKEE